METVTKSPKETTDLGQKIASSLVSNKNSAIILALTGDLGSGKTTFVQGLAKGLGVKQRILSPTFILMRKYNIKLSTINSQLSTFYHIDLYRLEGAVESELKNIGAPDIWGKKQNVVAVEWAEKVTGMFPGNTVWIKFENLGGNRRKITMK